MGNASTEQREPTRAHREGMYHMCLGLFLFGGVQGWIVGLSTNEGISNTLVTSLFPFVGGVLLTYTGFRVSTSRDSRHGVEMDPVRVGNGLTFFSLGLLIAINVAAFVRHAPPATGEAHDTGQDPTATPTNIHVDAILRMPQGRSDGGNLRHAEAPTPGGLATDVPAPRNGRPPEPSGEDRDPFYFLHGVDTTTCQAVRANYQDGYRGPARLEAIRSDVASLLSEACQNAEAHPLCGEQSRVQNAGHEEALAILRRVLRHACK